MKTAHDQIKGTLLYAAPEQLHSEQGAVGKQTDVFALGAILCEILTGLPPCLEETDRLDDPTLQERIFQGAAGKDPLPGLVRLKTGSADADLLSLAQACLARDPSQRLPDAGTVVSRLHTYKEHLRQRAEDQRVQREKKEEAERALLAEARAHHRLLAVATLTVLILLGGSVAGWVLKVFADQKASADARRHSAELSAQRSEQDRLRAESQATLEQQQRLQQEGQALFAQGARAAGDHDPLRARRLFAQSLTRGDTPETRKWLADVWNTPVLPITQRAMASAEKPDAPVEIRHVRYFPDGKRVAVACAPGGLWVLDRSLKDIKDPWRIPVDSSVTALAINPDSSRIALGTEKKTVEIWDVASRQRRQEIKLSVPPRSLAFSPSGWPLAVGADQYGAALVDPDTGEWLKRPPIHRTNVNAIAVIRAGTDLQWLLAGTRSLMHVQLDFDSLSDFNVGVSDHEMFTVAASPDSRFIATGGALKQLRVFDQQLQTAFPLPGHTDDVLAVAFLPDCKTLVSASADETVRLWDLENKTQLAILDRHKGGATSVAVSPDGSQILTAGRDGLLRLWQVVPSHQVITATDSTVSALTWASDTKLLMADWSGNLGLWNIKNPYPPRRIGGATVLDPSRMAVAPSSRAVYLADCFTRAILHHKPLEAAEVPSDSRMIRNLQSSNDESVVMVTSARQGPDGRSQYGRQTLSVDAAGPILAINPAGTQLASASAQDGIQLRDLTPKGELRTLQKPTQDPVRAMTFSPAGDVLAVGTAQGQIECWDLQGLTRKPLTLRHEKAIRCLEYLKKDGQEYLLSAGADRTIYLWEADTGKKVRAIEFDARALDISAEGDLLAAGNANGQVGLWDLPSGKKLVDLPGHRRGARAIAFRPDGRLLASGGDDGEIRIWDLAFLRPLRREPPQDLLAALDQPGPLLDSLPLAPDRWQEVFHRLLHLRGQQTFPEVQKQLRELEEKINSWPADSPITAEGRVRLRQISLALVGRYFEEGRKKKEKPILENALRLASHMVTQDDYLRDGDLLFLRGQIHEALEDPVKAVQDYREAEVAWFQPRDKATSSKLASLQYQRARLFARLALLPAGQRPREIAPRAVINPSDPSPPDDAEPWINQAAFSFHEAVRHGFQSWIQVLDDGLLPVLQKNPQTLELLKKEMAGNTLIWRAQELLRQKKYAQVLEVLSLILASAPQASAAHQLRGEVFLQQKQTAEAIAAFSASLAENPNNADAFYGLGRAHLREGKSAEAIKDLSKAIDLSQFIPRGEHFVARGDAYRAQKQYPQALEDYFEARKSIFPDREPYFRGLECIALMAESAEEKDRVAIIDSLFTGFEDYLKQYPRDKNRLLESPVFKGLHNDERWKKLSSHLR